MPLRFPVHVHHPPHPRASGEAEGNREPRVDKKKKEAQGGGKEGPKGGVIVAVGLGRRGGARAPLSSFRAV